jgi:hypothetical protein
VTPSRTIKIYFEGGSSRRVTDRTLRRGMSTFLRDIRGYAQSKGVEVKPVPSGSRNDAYKDFLTAHGQQSGDVPVLLIDSEGQIAENTTVWDYLARTESMRKPKGIVMKQCFLMVESMEAWLAADKRALGSYYGPHFNERKVPDLLQIEKTSKDELLRCLKSATSRCPRSYCKRDAFELIGTIDPELVQETRAGTEFFTGLRELIDFVAEK